MTSPLNYLRSVPKWLTIAFVPSTRPQIQVALPVISVTSFCFNSSVALHTGQGPFYGTTQASLETGAWYSRALDKSPCDGLALSGVRRAEQREWRALLQAFTAAHPTVRSVPKRLLQCVLTPVGSVAWWLKTFAPEVLEEAARRGLPR